MSFIAVRTPLRRSVGFQKNYNDVRLAGQVWRLEATLPICLLGSRLNCT
jgi:hypothetical protein